REFDLVRRYADGRLESVPALAAELAALKPDVILTGNIGVVVAARSQIGTIPTVFASGVDPVALGIVQSYRRPGGNITGVTSVGDYGIPGKRLQPLVDAVKGATRIGLLVNPDTPAGQIERPLVEAAAAALGVTLVPFEIRRPEDFDAAFAAFVRANVA